MLAVFYLIKMLKFKDTDITNASIASAGEFVNSGTFLDINEGDDESDRDGREIIVKGLELKAHVTNTNTLATLASGSNTTRIILYLDYQCNGAAPAVTDILETANVHSFVNWDMTHRFMILMDKCINTHVSTHDGTNWGGSSEVYLDWDIELDNSIMYKGTGSGIADLTSENIGMLLVSETDQAGIIKGFVRIVFED